MYVFVEMMIVRALGYWTRQFDACPRNASQDDPMPFELAGAAGAARAAAAARAAPPGGRPRQG